MARPKRAAPSASSANCPDAPCDDPVAEVARQLALRFRAVIGGRSLRSLRTSTGVEHTTITAVLNGTTWPDLATIARLELGLGADLWPGRARPT